MKHTADTSVILEKLKSMGAWPHAKTQVIYDVARANGFTYNLANKTFLRNKVSRGLWDISSIGDIDTLASPTETPKSTPSLKLMSAPTITNEEVFIPEKDPTFISWGEFRSIRKIVASKQFFPLYISGMSGNGKTMNVEQACAFEKRQYIRVQISPETDEDDLIGGFRLVDGHTVFQKGPVIKAMEAGAILLIDEIDRGSNKIMCLQGVLEGKPVLIKKIGEMVFPAPGFNVIATANTAGRGSEDGRYVAAQIIDDAFLERFVASIDQPYPEYNHELKIVNAHMDKYDIHGHEEFAQKLVSWSGVIRKTYDDEGVDEVISTRRLCHIVRAFGIFNDKLQAIKMCINRFDPDTREAFIDLYTKIDAGEKIQSETQAPSDITPEQVPF